MGEFPSGQRGQTVNLLSMTSVVRIHLPPPNSALKDAEFCFILSTFRTILCIFIKAAPDRARQFSGANRCCFLFFSLFLTARRGQSQLACCLSLRDIDANPDANGDGTKRACLDRMRHNSDTRLLFLVAGCHSLRFSAFLHLGHDAADDPCSFLLHSAGRVRVDVQREARAAVAEHRGDCFYVHAAL